MRQGVWCVPVERSAGAADGDVCRSVRSVCSVQCSQRWAFTVERSARVAEGDVRRSVRRLQRLSHRRNTLNAVCAVCILYW